MADFVDPIVIAQINGAKDELVAEVAKISANSDTIEAYADSLPNPIIPEAPSDGKTYGRKDEAWVEVAGGSSGEAVWGGITGNLSDQTDLQNALDAKTNDNSLATVAKTGLYSDLFGKPTILPDAPSDGQQYARINNAWAVVEATLAEDPTLLGTVTIENGANDLVIEQDNSYIYFSRPSPFAGQYQFRFRVGNTGLEFSTDTNGQVWTPVGGGTNLGNTSTSTSVTITSSTGSNTVISAATANDAGVMTAADKIKLDNIQPSTGTDLGATYSNSTVTVTSSSGADVAITSANSSQAGVMSRVDKLKLDGIENGAEVNTVDTVFGRSGAVVAQAGDYTASQVDVAATPTNYTAASADVEAHLAGIDSALASSGGGGGGTQRILTYSLNASLGSYTPLEDDSGTALSSPTILASLVGSDPDAVLSYWNTNFPDVKMFKICGGRGNTNMPSGFATAEYWDMTICRNTQSTNEVMIYHVKPVAIFDTISATEVGKEYSRTFRSGANKFTGAWVEI